MREQSPFRQKLVVAGQENLFFDLVCALLEQACPDASIERDLEDGADWRAGVRVTLEGSNRWLFVSTGGGADQQCARALRDGAWALLSLDSRSADFRLAIDALVRGTPRFVPTEIMLWLANAAISPESNSTESTGDPAAPVRLTAREREVLKLVAMGLSNGEIANALTISTNTVRTHVHSLAVKFESTSRTKMLARAALLGMYEMPRLSAPSLTA